jgi:hypothetical protein
MTSQSCGHGQSPSPTAAGNSIAGADSNTDVKDAKWPGVTDVTLHVILASLEMSAHAYDRSEWFPRLAGVATRLLVRDGAAAARGLVQLWARDAAQVGINVDAQQAAKNVPPPANGSEANKGGVSGKENEWPPASTTLAETPTSVLGLNVALQ